MSKFEKPKNPAMNYVSNTEPEKNGLLKLKKKKLRRKRNCYIEVPVQRETKSVR